MAAALVFLIGQLFLFGTTSAQCPVPCTPCKVFPDGDYKGTWNIKAEIDPLCPGRCLYQRNSDGQEMCFCDPGPIDYETCYGHSVTNTYPPKTAISTTTPTTSNIPDAITTPIRDTERVPPQELFTENINHNETAAEDLIKLIRGACHSSHAIATDGLNLLKLHPNVSSGLIVQLKNESDKILEEKEEWICGISQILSLIKDEQVKEELSNILPLELQQNNASRSEPDNEPHKRIILGQPATPGQIPWQGLIMRVFPQGSIPWSTRCGCVLIQSCYVLTARHCTARLRNPSEDMSIILGDVNVPPSSINPGEYNGPGQERNVMYVHYHPNTAYDVALILLKSSSSVAPSSTPIIKPIKLADFTIADDSDATVSGFGWTSGSGPTSPILNDVKVKVPSSTTCKQYYPNLAPHEICAGGFNPYRGACYGDSGGPLTQTDPATLTQKLIGLVERGMASCPTNMMYGVYVNPSFPAIKTWIDSIMPTIEPTTPGGLQNGTGEPCACLRPSVNSTNDQRNASHFNDINNRNCLLRFLSPNSTCGRTSPHIPISILNPATLTGIASPYTCWAQAGPPWSQNCTQQSFSNGKAYLKPWNPSDCPVELDSVPEYTHAYIASPDSGIQFYLYGYAKQQLTSDVDLTAEACFSWLSTVTLSSGEKVSISQLRIGDILQTVDSNKKLINSPFLGWLHKNQNMKTTFLDIITEDDSFISLTPLHLILTTKSSDQEPTMKLANSVSVGDYLVSSQTKSLLKVVFISKNIRKGVYAPLTESGMVMVDGLVASCYAQIQSHELAHFALLPVRIMPGLLEDRNSQFDDGIRTYVKYLMKFANPLYIKKETEVKQLSGTSIAASFLASFTSV